MRLSGFGHCIWNNIISLYRCLLVRLSQRLPDVSSHEYYHWYQTPGKPGVGTGGTTGSYPTFSTPSTVPWSATRNDVDLIQERGQTEDSGDKTQSFRALASYANSKNSDTTVICTTGQMWPPPIFDSSRLSERSVGGYISQESSSYATTTDNQWGTTPFSGQTAATAGSLLGSPNSFPNINHTQTLNPNPWSFDNSNNCSYTPRAITGQQLNVTLATTPPETSNSEHTTRRYMHWTLGSEHDLLNDDRSGLAFPLSNININNNDDGDNDNHNSVTGFCSQSEFIGNQALTASMNTSARGGSKLSELDVGKSVSKKSGSDIDTFACDTEEAIRTAVNTTEPWGIHPVDQSTPWNCSEANGDCLPIHSSAPETGSPPANEASIGSRISGNNPPSTVSNIQPSCAQSSLHPRRLSSTNASVSRDLESNVWPSEPPNGTGIWESHYESLGERTARWHQSTNSTQTSQPSFSSHPINQANFATSQMSHPPIRSRPQQGQLPPTTESFRGINRPIPGTIFPLGQPPPSSNVMNLGTRPIFGGNHSLGSVNSNVGTTGQSRGFPMTAPVNLGSGVSWPYSPATHPGDPAVPGLNFGNKSRWPGPTMNRLPGGKQQHPSSHILPNMTSTGLRWPPGATTPQMQGVWPLTDQRRPGTMQGPLWPTSTSGMENNPGGFFNQPTQSITPRVSQQISGSDFPSSLAPTRGINQAFRTPQSAFYSAMTPGFTSSSMSQRMFMSPQQHSLQLQQQSVIRAHVMRQLFSLGFSEDEIQPVFADTNTSVERALVDLRDRSGHPGIDELINSLKPITASLLPSHNPDDGNNLSCRLDMPGQGGSEVSKSNMPVNSQPAENLELSLHLLQQRESQILQTIVQLHSKHQELNQKLSHIRSANVPFATNPVIQELQLQAFQVAQQIDAQQAQLKHVRSQAGMLKQITVTANLPNPNPSQNHPTGPLSLSMGQPSSNLHSISTLASNCGPLNFSKWTLGSTKSNQPSNIPHTISGNENPDFTQEQSNFNMNSLLWESSPWSGSSPHLNENFSTNRSNLSTDRRWTPGVGGGGSSSSSNSRLPFLSSQLPPLGDPRWIDIVGDVNSSASDTRRQSSVGEVDEIRGGSGGGSIDFPIIPISVSSKSWLLAHNIPPHVSVGMLKMTVSSALSNHIKSSESSAHDKSGDSRMNEPDFEFHPNMSARWVLLGLYNSTQASVVHNSLEAASNIQSLASRLKGLNTDGCLSSASSNIHSVSQSSIIGCDFSGNSRGDLSGTSNLLIGLNTVNNNNSSEVRNTDLAAM
ncbi:unnamed protein product [Heterobilharzia americana]|nr:unnamed protein product [Heterobilharzia americana]